MPRAPVTECRRLRVCYLLAVSTIFTVALPGCGGCWNSSQTNAQKTAEEEAQEKEKEKKEKKKKKKSEKPVEDFTFGRILAQPNDVKKGSPDINFVKRGHWVAASQQMRANNFDVQAELHSMTADTSGVPFDIEHTIYTLLYSRPVPLAKGSAKPVESLFFMPRERLDSRPPSLRNELIPQRGGFQIQPETTPVIALDEWQYVFLVLSSRTSNFGIIDVTNTVAPAHDAFNIDATTDPAIQYYKVLKPIIDKRVPLPANPLAWTSIAVILWDDIDPNKLDGPQQQAMLDWLHWGGHLVISGPNSLDRLNGTFLEPYLPATNKQSVNLTQDSFDEINQHWSLSIARKPQIDRNLKLVKDIVGIELALAPHGEFLPHTGKLVAAGRVGHGKVVVTGFSLASGAFQTWKNVDGFLNGALLLRPGREFQVTKEQGALGYKTAWKDSGLADFRRDARLISNLRFFSRDMGFAPGDEKLEARVHPYSDLTIVKAEPNYSNGEQASLLSSALKPGIEGDERFGGYLAVPRAGVGSWNDFSGTAIVARKHLNDAAGVTIPKADFVLKILAIYLLILVPVNWSIFRAMGRVEWAWVAAPVIAVVGAVTVVKLAQLDIGFVRSRTEIDVIELQPGYSRAHVSRFIALYTSLATGYDLTFAEPTALAQPFALNASFTRSPYDRPSQVQFRHDSNLRLSGFKVASNSTGLVHAEQMHDLGGTLELSGEEGTNWQIKNGTDLELREAGILRRSLSGEYFVAYLPELNPGTTANLVFRSASTTDSRVDKAPPPQKIPRIDEWQSSAVFGTADETKKTGELRLGRFADLAAKHLHLSPGAARLIAWSPKEVDGITYVPDAPQANGISFVLAHLRRGPLPAPQVDQNVIEDVKQNNDPLKAIDATDPATAKPAELEQSPQP